MSAETVLSLQCFVCFILQKTEPPLLFLSYPSVLSYLETIESQAWLINSVRASKK